MGKKMGWLFKCDIHEEIAPTLMIHSVQKVVIRSPMDVAIFHAERDVNVQDALKALLGISMPTDVSMLPGGNLDARITLQQRLEVTDHEIQLFGFECDLECFLSDSEQSSVHYCPHKTRSICAQA